MTGKIVEHDRTELGARVAMERARHLDSGNTLDTFKVSP